MVCNYRVYDVGVSKTKGSDFGVGILLFWGPFFLETQIKTQCRGAYRRPMAWLMKGSLKDSGNVHYIWSIHPVWGGGPYVAYTGRLLRYLASKRGCNSWVQHKMRWTRGSLPGHRHLAENGFGPRTPPAQRSVGALIRPHSPQSAAESHS